MHSKKATEKSICTVTKYTSLEKRQFGSPINFSFVFSEVTQQYDRKATAYIQTDDQVLIGSISTTTVF